VPTSLLPESYKWRYQYATAFWQPKLLLHRKNWNKIRVLENHMKPNRIKYLSLSVALLLAALAFSQTGSSNAQDQIIDLEHRYMTAIVQADQAELKKILADDYLSVAATGAVYNRTTTLDFYRPDSIQKASVDEMKVLLWRYRHRDWPL